MMLFTRSTQLIWTNTRSRIISPKSAKVVLLLMRTAECVGSKLANSRGSCVRLFLSFEELIDISLLSFGKRVWVHI